MCPTFFVIIVIAKSFSFNFLTSTNNGNFHQIRLNDFRELLTTNTVSSFKGWAYPILSALFPKHQDGTSETFILIDVEIKFLTFETHAAI